MVDVQIYDVAIIPLIVAVVGLLRSIGLPARWAPVAAAAIGIVIGIFYVAPGEIGRGILVGLAMGLSAVGLYSGVKNTMGK